MTDAENALARLAEMAVPMDVREFTRDEYNAAFPSGTVVSVVVSIENQNVVISTYKRKKREVRNKIKAGRLLYVREGAGSRTNGV